MRLATTRAIAKTAASVEFAPADEDRGACIIQNNVGAVLYLRFDGPAALALFGVAVPPNASFVVPDVLVANQITGVWATGGGQLDAAMVTLVRGL